MSLTRKARGRPFCALFNLRAALRGVDARVRFDAGSGAFRVASDGYELRFRHEGQAYYACKRGIRRRTEILRDTYFLDRIEFSPGDLVVDCGANVGELKYCFLVAGLAVEYVGIEPAPLEFECLKENVAPSEAINAGLWHEDGELEFFLSSQMADSSLIEPASYDRVVRVPVKRLDTLLPDRRIKLLKLEAEGAEPEAIRGCEGILEHIEYVSADVGWERGAQASSTMPAVTNYLLARGFELVEVGRQRLTALYRNRLT